MRVLGGGSTRESRVVGAGDCEGVAGRHPDAKSSKVVETEDAIEADAEEPAPVRVARVVTRPAAKGNTIMPHTYRIGRGARCVLKPKVKRRLMSGAMIIRA